MTAPTKSKPGPKPVIGLPDSFAGKSEDDILQAIESGESILQIAKRLNTGRSTLARWLDANEERSARAKVARIAAAAAWEEMAEEAILSAVDGMGLGKARELAQHYRWRASKIAPLYGDKVRAELTGQDGKPIEVRQVSDNEAARRVSALLMRGLKTDG